VTVDIVEVQCDGGARGNPGPAAIGAVVLDVTVDPPELIATVSECIGIATNNVAEYKACIEGLRAAAEFEPRQVRLRADSELMIRQLEGRYRVKSAHLKPLYEEARALLNGFDEVDLAHIRREKNVEADALVNAALDAVER
jgi:ribonuclease HI